MSKSNHFELVGRVGWLEKKITHNGKIITSINLGVRKSPGVYDNFFIKFFNTEDEHLADRISESVSKDDYIRVTGTLKVEKYVPPEYNKSIDRVCLTGWDFKHQGWDKDKKEFIDIE